MDMRERILAETRRLTLHHGVVPSLNTVADAAGVSKGGLIHHFPTRAALVDGLAQQALADVDLAMTAAARAGTAASAWLRLSVPVGEDLEVFRAMAIAHHALGEPGTVTVQAATEAIRRWERLIAEEIGDRVLARIIRLVGDGLAMNALVGTADRDSGQELDELVERLVAQRRGQGA
ncbi:TetR/AcrR family transcriptional regulator [Lysobacter korlensis]|uniref:TetR/AcrR family transcriptional regulator n=1 Tax=Lysobacter korlensis TaxID=553636 RepID=A0ABV6RZC1_9GAMM